MKNKKKIQTIPIHVKKQKVDTIKSPQELVFFFWLINQKVRARQLFFFSFSFFIAYLPEKRLFSSLPSIWCLSEWIICKV